MTEKLIYIPNDNTQITPSSVYYNYWLKRLDTQLNDPTNQNLVKVPKLLGQRIRIDYWKTLGTGVINCPMSPPSLTLNCIIFLQYYKHKPSKFV